MFPRPSLPPSLAALAFALAAIQLQGCGPLQDLVDRTTSPTVPPAEPPPAGFATDMLDAHDAVRADPVSFGATQAPDPVLPALGWSSTVAARAQAYANGCTYAHDGTALHDLGYGENIAASTGSHASAYIVGLWASEAPFYDYASITCDETNPANTPHTCFHYTQLVWRSTTVVGCGVQTCTTGSPWGSGTWYFWVCDYAPAGNVNVATTRPY